MGTVHRLKYKGQIVLACNECGKTNYEVVMDEDDYEQGKGGLFLVCRSRGCGERFRIYADLTFYAEE